MARRIRIKRNKRPDVLRMSDKKLPKSSFGAGQATSSRSYACMWCFYPKTSITARCEDCGKLGSTSTPQSAISQVYVEETPIYTEVESR